MKKMIVLVCILALLVTAALLAGCGSGGSGSATPESVAKAFWTAALTGNANASWAMLSKELQANLKNKDVWAKSAVTNTLGGGTIEVGKATVTGDTATVTIKVMNGGKEVITEKVSLVKEGGVWKVALP